MLYLILKIGESKFALPSVNVVTITPVVKLDKIPRMPDYVVGMFNFKGKPIAVIDFSLLIYGVPTSYRLHTRIVICALQEQNQTIGLLVENVSGAIKLKESEFVDSNLNNEKTEYLGEIAVDESGLVRRIDINNVINRDIANEVFKHLESRQVAET